MAPIERDAPRDADRVLRHQSSASFDAGRAMIPMWDSSDPDRAPPPLPLNPQSPSVTSRAGTSSAIQSAYAALTEKARESGLVTTAIAKRMSEVSPEKPSAKGTPNHRRMQSLQPGTVRDLSYMLEGRRDSAATPTPRSPEKTDRPATPSRNRDALLESRSEEKPEKALTVSSPKPGSSLTPIVRPTVRRPHHSILGENTPPQSATMLALQNMATPPPREADTPLATVTNGTTALTKAPQSLESVSGQILVLTNIATALQREMAQLSRRSRDNATDLLSLKEATSARDEDIRKSLRDLIHTNGEGLGKSSTRDPYGAPLLLEGKPHSSPPMLLAKTARPFSLPRIPSPNSFAASIDRESMSTPSLYGADSSASAALLEKILRDMGTKEGQDALLSRLTELSSRLVGMDSSSKLDELVQLVKSTQGQSLMPAKARGGGSDGPGRPRDFSFDASPSSRALEYEQSPPGPMTARVGRLLARADERRASAPQSGANDLISEDFLNIIRSVKDSVAQGGGLTAEVKALVRELRGEVLGMGREIGRRLDATEGKRGGTKDSSSSRADPAEVRKVIDEGLAELKQHMNNLLREHRRQSSTSTSSKGSVVDYQEIYNALRAALKDSQASRSQGRELSRDDIIAAVRDAWERYRPEADAQRVALERDEILTCLKEGLAHYGSNCQAGATSEEVFSAVVEGLKHFSPPHMESAASLSRDEILEAVRECLEEFEFPVAPSAIGGELSKKDMVDAVRQGLSSMDLPRGAASASTSVDSEVVERLHDVVKSEIRAMRDAMNSSLVPASASNGSNHAEVLKALEEGISSIRAEVAGRPMKGVADMLDTLHDGLGDLRSSIDKLHSKPVDLTASDEILDALKTGLEGVRSDIGGLRSGSKNDRALATVKDGAEGAVVPADVLKHEDIKNLEVLIAQLRIKVEAMETPPTAETLSKDDLSAMEDMMRNVQESVAGMSSKGGAPGSPADSTLREDIQAIETILRNTKARLDDLVDGEQAVRKDHIDSLETLIHETREGLSGIATQLDSLSRKEDISLVEAAVAQVANGLDEMKERAEKHLEDPERITKADVEAIEAVCLDVKSVVEQMVQSDIAALTSKEDVKGLEATMNSLKDRLDALAESSDKATEDRQAEAVGIAAHVSDVKKDLADFHGMIKEKLEDGVGGIASLSEIVAGISESLGPDANIRQELKDMFETMQKEFELSKAGVVGAKLESDEKFQQTTETLQAKIDERIDELLSKYEELRSSTEDRAKAGQTREEEIEAAVQGTKSVSEDLKSMVDTLGSAVTDSLERMEEASKTVFTRVDDMVVKADELHSDNKQEHQHTRDEVKQAVGIAQGIQGHVVEYQPKILETIKDVLLIVGQHYEHSKNSISTIQEKIEEAKQPEQPLLPPVEKYDDSEVHAKLDRLVDHSKAADKAFAHLDTLEHVHQQVRSTAADLAGLAAAHTQRIADQHEDRERTLQETTVALERQTARAEEVEARLARLREEEERLLASVGSLRTEQDGLLKRKTGLAADVASLETALHLRREELHDMEGRVEALERRIVERVMDHSRIMMLGKSGSKGGVAGNGPDIMSRKRVASQRNAKGTDANQGLATEQGGEGKAQQRQQKTARIAAMAVHPTRSGNLLAAPQNSGGQTARRILSLSQITGNAPSAGFKRSQSVRHVGSGRGLRKSSWAGPKGYGDLDKENVSVVRESDEEGEDEERAGGDKGGLSDGEDEFEDASAYASNYGTPRLLPGGADDDEDGEGHASGAETPRRSSHGTTVVTETETGLGTVTGSEYSADDDETDGRSEWTESALGTERSSVGVSELGVHDG